MTKFWKSWKSDSTGPGETSGASDRVASKWGISRSKRPINWIMRQKKLKEEINAKTKVTVENIKNGRKSMESAANTEYDQYMRYRQNVEYEENIENGDVNRQTQNMQGRQSMESVANTEYDQYMQKRQNVEYEENRGIDIEEQKAIRDLSLIHI